mmetsp:Transcript_13272/g.28611  ORF Transcript_13272/g.28611 Transcript_13272/m.28611 type:complete len:217 (-) Transcript_13272:78-728(-)|eukprot:6203785-Pleurochrysis_carterae.AAC.3
MLRSVLVLLVSLPSFHAISHKQIMSARGMASLKGRSTRSIAELTSSNSRPALSTSRACTGAIAAAQAEQWPSNKYVQQGTTRRPAFKPLATVTAQCLLLSNLLLSQAPQAIADEAAREPTKFEPRGITTEDTIVFILGCVPFVWAGIEFWRRIAVGDPFGTGRDSVIINDTSGNRPQPVRRVLGKDAIIAARILFALAFASGALVLVAGLDVLNNQ